MFLCVYISPNVHTPEYTLTSRLPGSLDKCTFSFTACLQIVVQSGYTNLYSHELCLEKHKVPIFLSPMFFNYETSVGSIMSFFFHLSLIKSITDSSYKETSVTPKHVYKITALAMQKLM